jgi:hypothetical protein
MWQSLARSFSDLSADDRRCAASSCAATVTGFRCRRRHRGVPQPARHPRAGAGLPRAGGRRLAGGGRLSPADDRAAAGRLHRWRAGDRRAVRPAHLLASRRVLAHRSTGSVFRCIPPKWPVCCVWPDRHGAGNPARRSHSRCAEALAKGLVTRVVADAEVVDEAYASARRICAGAPLVARWHKQWVRRLQHDIPLSEQELRASFAFLETEDYREGLSAFSRSASRIQRPLIAAFASGEETPHHLGRQQIRTPAKRRFRVATGRAVCQAGAERVRSACSMAPARAAPAGTRSRGSTVAGRGAPSR